VHQYSKSGGDDIGQSLVGNKHLRSLSFTDSRDIGDNEANNDIFIINTNAAHPSVLLTELMNPEVQRLVWLCLGYVAFIIHSFTSFHFL
jgi:hypothetical protein